MERWMSQTLRVTVRDVRTGERQDAYVPVRLVTNHGPVDCRYYEAPGTTRAAVWVGGVGGGWDTPAKGLYPRLCGELATEGIASLRVRYRQPTELGESVADVLAGLQYLRDRGMEAVALTGHSLGGAVVIQAAVASDLARTVVTLATQSYGAGPARDLAPRCSILVIHGTGDRVLPYSSSEHVYDMAEEPKSLVLYDGAGHMLDEVAEEVHDVVRNWIVGRLSVA